MSIKNLKFNFLILISVVLTSLIFPHIYVKAENCNHEWTEWEVEEKATCGCDGYEGRECKICYKYESRTIPATGNHNWVLNSSLSDEATCIHDGEKWYDCSVCDANKKETIPATGVHKWTEWKADGYLCEDGKYTRYCELCYEEQTKERKGDGSHVWSDWKVWEEPNCLNKGEEVRECLNCYEFEYRDIPIDENKHNWCDWYSEKSATALSKGIAKRECYVCSIVQKKETPKLKAKLKLYTKSKTVKIGKTFKIGIKEYTYGDKVYSYKSSNKKVATVDKAGKVKAKKKGTANITVTMKSGCKAICKVNVK